MTSRASSRRREPACRVMVWRRSHARDRSTMKASEEMAVPAVATAGEGTVPPVPVESEGWDRIVRITTPEGVEVRLAAAGLGTRFLAFLLDYLMYYFIVSSVAGV